MARSSFSASKATPRPAHKKRFTLVQANRSLPLVKRIVTDIVHTHDLAVVSQTRLEKLHDAKELTSVQSEIDRTIERLGDLLSELNAVGCELKDYQTGLVDFVGSHEGRDVFLCWKLGEERINYWHELNSGFAGRKPVSILDETI